LFYNAMVNMHLDRRHRISALIRRTIASVFSLLLFVPMMVAAQGTSYDDMWWNPVEPGWGVNVVQQDNVLYLTWFIYATDGAPTWVTSDMRTTNGTTFTGNVYGVTGAAYNAPIFSAGPPRTVGSASFILTDANHGTLTYSIDGVSVSKAVQRFAFSTIDLTGSYEGLIAPGSVTTTDATTFTVTVQGNAVRIEEDAFFSGTCIRDGMFSQYGSRIAASGTYQCSDFATGTWKSDDLSLIDGIYLAGQITIKPTGSTQQGIVHLLAARDEYPPEMPSSKSRQDMWWNPAEPGWGVNVVQQNNVLFLTWFIFGADGKPTWVTSDMRSTDGVAFSGNVYSTTGAAYSAPVFVSNPAVTVGTATLTLNDANHGTLIYSIGGSQVTKAVQRLTFASFILDGRYEGSSRAYTIFTSGSSAEIRSQTPFGDGDCIYTGALAQLGKQFAGSGTYKCADFTKGTWTTDDLRVAEGRSLLAKIVRTDDSGVTSAEFATAYKP
jgi:hypothetical protein